MRRRPCVRRSLVVLAAGLVLFAGVSLSPHDAAADERGPGIGFWVAIGAGVGVAIAGGGLGGVIIHDIATDQTTPFGFVVGTGAVGLLNVGGGFVWLKVAEGVGGGDWKSVFIGLAVAEFAVGFGDLLVAFITDTDYGANTAAVHPTVVPGPGPEDWGPGIGVSWRF